MADDLRARAGLALYAAAVLTATLVHDPRLLGAGLLAACAAAGAERLWLLRRTLRAVLAFNLTVSLGYLLVGVVLGPHTPGPVIEGHQLRVLAEFGIVFLLFTIGLSFSLPQIHALRHQVLGLGTGQVVLTTAIVGLISWLAGLPPAAAFVVGAVFAQSSTTIWFMLRYIAVRSGEGCIVALARYRRLNSSLS